MDKPKTIKSNRNMSIFESWLIPKKCPECGKRKIREGWNVCTNCMGDLDVI